MELNQVNTTKSVNPFSKTIKDLMAAITVEPVLVIFVFSYVAASITTQNLNLEKACRVNLRYNKIVCDGMVERNTSKYNQTDEVEVQKLIATVYVWRNIIASGVPGILLLFWGSWSDRNGKTKNCIIMPVFGAAVSTIGYIVCTYYFYEIRVEYSVLIEVLPWALTGSWYVLLLGSFSYVSKNSSIENRTVRLGALTTLFNVSFAAGIAASGVVYVFIGYYGVFLLALSMYTIAFLYGWFGIAEVPSKPAGSQKNGLLKDFFNTEHIVDTFKLVIRNKNQKKKNRLCIVLVLIFFINGPMSGEETVLYLFVRYRFKWNEIDYSVYSFYNSVLHIVATIFSLTFFAKYLQMDDALIGLISSTSKILAAFVYCFATSGPMFYLGSTISVFNGTSNIAMRSIVSKLVAKDELGKINSLFGMCESLIPLIFGPVYSLIYKWTITFMPGFFYLFGSTLTLPGILIFLWLYREHKNDEKEEKLNSFQKIELLQTK